MNEKQLIIKKTTLKDLANIRALWADGDVMRFVGFENGLKRTMAQMKAWHRQMRADRPNRCHYSVYREDIGFCGETYYAIEPEDCSLACLDIKLVKAARGKGIGTEALIFVINQAMDRGADAVYVTPNRKNEKALALYRRLGFEEAPVPEIFSDDMKRDIEDHCLYMSLQRRVFPRHMNGMTLVDNYYIPDGELEEYLRDRETYTGKAMDYAKRFYPRVQIDFQGSEDGEALTAYTKAGNFRYLIALDPMRIQEMKECDAEGGLEAYLKEIAGIGREE